MRGRRRRQRYRRHRYHRRHRPAQLPIRRRRAAAIAVPEFLYSGEDAIQTPVAPGTIDPDRVVVLRGRVLGRDGEPLPGVTVSVHGHEELGTTLTRGDGRYDLAVNGGGRVTLSYELESLLPAHRSVDTPWLDFVRVADVVLVPLDSRVTPIRQRRRSARARADLRELAPGSGGRRHRVGDPSHGHLLRRIAGDEPWRLHLLLDGRQVRGTGRFPRGRSWGTMIASQTK